MFERQYDLAAFIGGLMYQYGRKLLIMLMMSQCRCLKRLAMPHCEMRPMISHSESSDEICVSADHKIYFE